jgi:pimeloyl-ACP methyl ester carboxylesterase
MDQETIATVKIVRRGSATGPVLVVFHGTPGSVAELAWWSDAAQRHGVQLWCVARAALPAHLQGNAYFAALARVVAASWALAPGAPPLHLAGFSLGGFVALQTALALQQQGCAVAGLHLLSAAAPLQGGDFLPHMAGQAVFRMAAQRPSMLRRVAAVQGWLARAWPSLLRRLLFASARSSDLALRISPEFQATVHTVLADALGLGREGYVRDLAAYVSPWGASVAELQTPAWVWHGAQDNWSPPAMAHWLHTHLTQCRGVQMWADQSHYGCLLQSVEPVCAMVASPGVR